MSSKFESPVALTVAGKHQRLEARLWRAAPWLVTLAVALIGVALFPRLQDYLRYSWDALFFPWQLNYDEGINVHASWLLAQNVNIYRPYAPDGFTSAMHPPLYFVLNAVAMKIWGLNLVSGRLLAFVGALSVGALLWAWVYVETRRHIGGVLAVLMWFSLGPVYIWSTLYKQDMPALALGLAGGVMVILWHKRQESGAEGRELRRPRWRILRLPLVRNSHYLLYWAIVPLSLSFWTKQSYIVMPAAVALFLLLHDRRVALRWTLLIIGSIVVPFLAFDLYTSGGFSEHLLAFRHYDYSVPYFNRNMRVLWTYHTPLVLCGLAVVALALWVSVRHRSHPRLGALYLLISIPAALVSFALPTANYNDIAGPAVAKYNQFLDILAPLCLVLGLALGTTLGSMFRARRGARLDWVCLTAGILLLAFGQVSMIYRQPPAFWYPPVARPLPVWAQQMEDVSRLIRGTPGDILSEDNWLLLKNDKLVIYDDPAAMAVLAREGAWEQSKLLQDLSRRRFSYVITEFALDDAEYSGRWSEQALMALQANYKMLQGTSGALVVSAPRPGP